MKGYLNMKKQLHLELLFFAYKFDYRKLNRTSLFPQYKHSVKFPAMKAIVVGSGVGGIASALRLRSMGIDVEILESCPDAGGRARTFSYGGHTFDAGPTVITAPWLFDELFELFGEKRSDHIRFLPCDPWYRLIFHDLSSMDLVSSVEAQEAEIRKISPEDADNYQAYLDHCEALYSVGYEQLGAADFSRFSSMLSTLPHLLRLGAFRSLWRHTARYFKDKRVRQAFSLQTLLVGGNPLNTTAIYGLIHAMERRGGIWFAKGGTGALIKALIELGKRHGIKVHYNSTVSALHTSGKPGHTVNGISYIKKGEESSLSTDLLVWGGDPIKAYQMAGTRRLSLVERGRLKTVHSSMGLYVMYFKTKRPYSEVAHHSIILSKRWEGLLHQVFSGKTLPHDPSLYLHRPAATDPGFQLSNGDLFYVLAPVPHLGNFNGWEEQQKSFQKTVVSVLEESALPNLSSELALVESIDPRYFKHMLHSHLGAGFSIAPRLSQSAWFRFHNKMDKVKGMYLCGAGVHPGGGLPGVATSAKVIQKMITDDFQESVSTHPNSLQTQKTPDKERAA